MLNIDLVTIVTILIALYGAILSTIVYRQSQPRLIVKGRLANLYGNHAIEIIATNAGQRPITIVSVQFKATNTPDDLTIAKDGHWNTDALPKMITDSQPTSIYVRLTYVVSPHMVEYLIAVDSTGRKYRSKRLPLEGQTFPSVSDKEETISVGIKIR